MRESRKLKRRHLIFYLRILNAQDESLFGYIVDITPEGLMVMSEKPIESNKVFDLKMHLALQGQKTEVIEFKAESVWSSQDVNARYYDSGLRLIDVDDDTAILIEDMINHLGFVD